MNKDNIITLELNKDTDFNEEFDKIYNSELDACIDITFNDLSQDEFINQFKEILQKEAEIFEENKNVLFHMNIKNLAKDYKLEALKYAISFESLLNSMVILNIYNLVKTYNSFDDSFFEHPDIYFNNIEEYLDIRTELMDQLQEFSEQLTIYYLSILKSYHITETDTAYLNLKVIPNIYQRILYITDFFTLSKIMSKCNTINVGNLINVQNADKFLASLSMKLVVSNDFINNLKED